MQRRSCSSRSITAPTSPCIRSPSFWAATAPRSAAPSSTPEISPGPKHADRFPGYNKPDASYHGLVYAERFGKTAYIERARSIYQRTMGSVLSPFNAFLLLQGIETVALRMERHVENARKVAEFLRKDSRVAWVNYTGFPGQPLLPAGAEISRR